MHDVFISYSNKDKLIADAACHTLERAGIRCWMAPRDVTAGVTYPAQIAAAITATRVLVLVFSENANLSPHVVREVSLALESASVVIPYRIEPVTPFDDLSYYLQGLHWLDAYPQPVEFAPLVEHVRRNLDRAVPASIPASPPVPDRARTAADEADLVIAPGGRYVGMVLSNRSFVALRAKGATLSKSVFRGCDFTNARLDSTVLSGAVFEGARLDRASLRDARMDFVNATEASCVDTDFEFARLTRADFRRANLSGASLHLIDGKEANFEDVTAVNARFSSALLRDANLTSADLRGADFTDAVLEGCSLEGADLTGAQGLTAEQLAVAITDRFTIIDAQLP